MAEELREFKLRNGKTFKAPKDTPPDVINKTARRLLADQELPTRETPVPTALESVNAAIVENPVGAVVGEFASGINRGAAQLADFFTTGPVNAALRLSGSETQIPTIEDALSQQTTGNFMDPGFIRDVVRTSGELVPAAAASGAALRGAAQRIPEVTQTIGQAITRQLGTSTAAGDAGFAIASGVGSEIGEEIGGDTGQVVGAILAPSLAAGGKQALTSLIKSGAKGISSLSSSLSNLSDDGASTLLAEAMVREGLTPDDVVRRLQDLGPEAIPADIGNNFARLLRTATNKIPVIEGRAANVFIARQSGQGSRILRAFDQSANTVGLTIDDEIARLDTVLRPRINKLYQETGEQGLSLSPKLRALFDGDSSIAKAQPKVQRRLADKRAAGDTINNIQVIDSTKQELDDQIGRAIRQGENNRARDLIRLKNIMVSEADASIPVYQQARNLFAGKASLENAAEIGQGFLRMKPRDLKEITKTFGDSERRMFRIGAKQAVLDKIDDLQTNADAVKRLFGKNGDVKKLRGLFDDEISFNNFNDSLRREADFVLTRRAAQGNSTTAKQLADDESAFNVLSDVAGAVSTPVGQANLLAKITGGLKQKKTTQAYIESLEQAGDILLVRGINPDTIRQILTRGSAKQIEARLKRALRQPPTSPTLPAATTGAIITNTEEQ